ncbi:unnamed protein product, partial [Heterosigma akashiwo]
VIDCWTTLESCMLNTPPVHLESDKDESVDQPEQCIIVVTLSNQKCRGAAPPAGEPGGRRGFAAPPPVVPTSPTAGQKWLAPSTLPGWCPGGSTLVGGRAVRLRTGAAQLDPAAL